MRQTESLEGKSEKKPRSPQKAPPKTEDARLTRVMVNNLNYSKLRDTQKAKFFLSELNHLMGSTQQAVIVNSILYAAQYHPQFARYYDEISSLFEKEMARKEQKKKNAITNK